MPAPLVFAFEGSRPIKYGVVFEQFTVTSLLPVVSVADAGTEPRAMLLPGPAVTVQAASTVIVMSNVDVATCCADAGTHTAVSATAPSNSSKGCTTRFNFQLLPLADHKDGPMGSRYNRVLSTGAFARPRCLY